MLYLIFCIVGAALPLTPAISFLWTHAFDVNAFFQQAIASPAALTAWLDVVVSALVLLIWIYREGERLAMDWLWLYGLATFLVGPSFGLPLFLYGRSRRLATSNPAVVLSSAQH